MYTRLITLPSFKRHKRHNPLYKRHKRHKRHNPLEEGGSGMVGTEAVVVIIVVVYSLYGDGVLAIAGPRGVQPRFRKSPVTVLQL